MAFEQLYASKLKSIGGTGTGTGTGTESLNGCFDCNICLDFASEPVVTLCGHLYCWPCIYKWLHVQSASLSSDEYPQCPVCKSNISHTTMVPLYGRGHVSKTKTENKPVGENTSLPPRPAARGTQAMLSNRLPSGQQIVYRNPYQSQTFEPPSYINSYENDSSFTSRLQHPMIGMVREMVYATVFGNSDSLYAQPNSYQITGSNSPRLRRQEMQADTSLNRISIFLFCCLVLCLIVF